MSSAVTVVAIGLVDARGVAGTSGLRADWNSLDVEAPGTARSFRALFGRPDATFRRIDRASKALVLATEAAGLADAVPTEARDATAVVIESERGCLDADLRFQHGLEQGVVEGAVFPYTLASASLGEVALRHGLRGPALCLSIGPEERGEALREAVRLIEDGEASFVLAGRVEALAATRSGVAPQLHAVVVLLAARDAAPHGVACDAWSADAFESLASTLVR